MAIRNLDLQLADIGRLTSKVCLRHHPRKRCRYIGGNSNFDLQLADIGQTRACNRDWCNPFKGKEKVVHHHAAPHYCYDADTNGCPQQSYSFAILEGSIHERRTELHHSHCRNRPAKVLKSCSEVAASRRNRSCRYEQEAPEKTARSGRRTEPHQPHDKNRPQGPQILP